MAAKDDNKESACRREDMLTILDILEGGGLPPLIVAVATEANQGRVLGEVLAQAVKVSCDS